MRAASLVAVLALALAAPAAAADSLKVGTLDASDYPTIRTSVVTSEPSKVAPTVRENGSPVVGLQIENLARAKSIALAVDRSRSMDGTALANAIRAARSFVASKSPDDRIMLIGFGRQAIRLTDFSSSTIDVDAQLAGLAVDDVQGTALYDSVALGSRALAAEANAGRVLIVLTDGDDVSSRTTLGKAANQARRAGAAVYAIGIEGEGFSPQALTELARVTGGAYFPAENSSAVAGAYESIAEQLRRTWRVTYLTAARPGEEIELAAAVPGGASGSATATMPGESSDSIVRPRGGSKLLPAFFYENNVGTMLLALIVGSCVILAVGLVLATPGGTRLRRRIEPHTAETRKRRGRRTGPRERFAAASGVLSATEKSLSHLKFWQRMHRQIERADLPLRTVEFFYICVGTGLLLGLVSAIAAVPPLLSLLAMVLGAFGPVVFVWFKAKKRMNAIEDQLPDLLITIAASLKAGHSFRQGLQAVVDEGQPPAADEFKRVLTETSLGRPMDDALAEMSERIGSKNLYFVITAVTIQRQVGGSLAGIFDMVADAVRQRQQFMRKIKGLTAMGRMSAYVLIGLPFFLAAMFTAINPQYMAPLWGTSAGHQIVGVGLVMMLIGSLLLKKIVSFKG
jgi:tight adherence protein B